MSMHDTGKAASAGVDPSIPKKIRINVRITWDQYDWLRRGGIELSTQLRADLDEIPVLKSRIKELEESLEIAEGQVLRG